jgi:nucleotide-binding universal stress UspA family protein
MTDQTLAPLTIRTVLVPLDGSRLAEAVLPIARGLAAKLGATITLLHVIEHDAPETIHGEPHLMTVASAESYLARVAADLRASGATVEIHVHDNPEKSVSESLKEHADELNPDLLLMASHGSGGVRGFLFGGLAQQVLRRSRRPLLMVHAREAESDAADRVWRCETVAVAIGPNGEGEAALPAAAAIARGFGAAIQLIRAAPTLGTLDAERGASAMLVPGATRALLEIEADQAREHLDALAARVTALGVTARIAIVRGDPAAATVAEAERSHAGLLAVATHGKAGLSSLWTGSVGAKIIDRATSMPLLLVRLGE